MTQNNEREALIEFKDAVKQLCNDFSSLQGNVYIKDVEASLDALCEQFIQSPKSQNEQQEAVAIYGARRLTPAGTKEFFGTLLVTDLKEGAKLYTAPPKQIPEGWISVNDRLPDNDYEVVFVLLNDLSCGATFSYEDAKTSLDDKTVDICFIRDGNKWGCSHGTYDLEKIKYWMSIPRVAPTTILTSETNTEVGE